jgi:DNA-binding NarL/FixJ family response regulator
MIRVALVDDQTLVRQGVRSLLGLLPDIEVVAEAGDGEEALRVLPAASTCCATCGRPGRRRPASC